jgi:hypothetical protein
MNLSLFSDFSVHRPDTIIDPAGRHCDENCIDEVMITTEDVQFWLKFHLNPLGSFSRQP